MSTKEMLERKNEILRKNAMGLMLRGNRKGLSPQEKRMMERFWKEYYQTAHEIQSSHA